MPDVTVEDPIMAEQGEEVAKEDTQGVDVCDPVIGQTYPSDDIKPVYQGLWWIPEYPEKTVHGVLRLTPYQSADLELFDYLGLEIGQYSGLIHGEAVDGTPITLCDLYVLSLSGQGREHRREIAHIQVGTVIIEGRWPTGAPIRFLEVEIEFRNLCTWSDYSPFRVARPAEDRSRNLTFAPDEIVPLFEDETMTIFLRNSAANNFSYNFREWDGRIHRKASVVLRGKEELSYSNYRSRILQIQSFLSFCLGVAAIPEKIVGKSYVNSITRPEGSPPELPNPVLLPISIETTDFHRTGADQFRDKKSIFPPLLFDDIREHSPSILQRWIESEEQFKIPRMLFFSTFFSSQMYLQQEFITRAQCIETYHRISDNYLDYLSEPRDYDHRICEARAALRWCTNLKKKQYERFISQIKNGNKPSLSNRIDQILKRHEAIVPLIISDTAGFANTVAKNRNHLTHCDNKPEETYATPEELWDLSQQLGRLFYLCILDELGLEQKIIETTLKRLKKWIIP